MIAVLAGDIIKSSRLTPEELQNVKDCIAETCDELRDKYSDMGMSQLFFFRGDGWQLAIEDPSLSLRVAVMIYAGLRHQNIAQTRIAIGIGEVEKLDLDNLDQSSGEAFERAGHCLDKMNTRSPDVVFAIDKVENSPRNQAALWGLTSCIAAIMSDWTARQAEIVLITLQDLDETYANLAKTLTPPISQQAFSDSLLTSKFVSLLDGLIAYQLQFEENK